ncbi:acyl-CoA synthetase FdrA [Treponema sp.]
MKKVLIKKDAYFDSVFLMLLSKQLKETPEVRDAVVAMGTPMNLELLIDTGYSPTDFSDAGPNDLIVAIDCASSSAIEPALKTAETLLSKKVAPCSGGAGKVASPRSLEGALEILDDANLALISLPGVYAAREARKALEKDLHVMLFSDNVSLEDEIALKTYARERGLLVMGPDCGTAIINGVPLCFANVVRRGNIGVVAASGTGLQEVTCLIDRFGAGVRQAIGTGGRDLKNEKVGGLTMLSAIEALAADSETKVITIVSKPPAKSVADKVTEALEKAGKPAVVHFIGLTLDASNKGSGRVRWATNLEEAARMATEASMGLATGNNKAREVPTPKNGIFVMGDENIKALVAQETKKMNISQKWIRGYFTGGTLADEAWILLHALTGAVYSNNQSDNAFVPPDPKKSIGHTIVDLGDDVFTVGRPHPMIDPSTRTERVDAEREDEEIAVMLVDVVLGYGSHEDPAGALLPSLVAAKKAAAKRGGYLSVVASITGTENDFQGYAGQKAKLEKEGIIVMPSNFQASMLAVKIMEKVVAK